MSGALVPFGGSSGGSGGNDGYGGGFGAGSGATQTGQQQQNQVRYSQTAFREMDAMNNIGVRPLSSAIRQGIGMFGGGLQGGGGGGFGGGMGQQGTAQQSALVAYGNQTAQQPQQQNQGMYQGGNAGSGGSGGLLALPSSTTATANNNPFQMQQAGGGGFGNNPGGFGNNQSGFGNNQNGFGNPNSNAIVTTQQQQPNQQQLQHQHQQQQVLASAANPFSNQLAPVPVGYVAPSAQGGSEGAGAWDPFSSSSAPPTTGGGGAQTGANWDPFAPGAATNGQQMQQQQPQQQQQQQQEDDWGLGELRDEDIWGTLPTKKDVEEEEDDSRWSDDDASEASRDEPDTRYGGRNIKGGRDDGLKPGTKAGSSRQEQADLELAMRLQREEEERAATQGRVSPTGRDSVTGGRGLSGIDRTLGATSTELALRPRQTAGSRPDGECFARISIRTLMVKKWKSTYFIFELPDLLLLYRSRDDHIYNPRGTMIKKRVEIKHNHTLTRLKRKVYKEHGYLWHFTLEEQMDYGPSIVAKFAHHERRVLEELGQRLAEAIREKRRLRQRFNQYGASGGAPPAPRHPSSSSGINNGRRGEYDGHAASSAAAAAGRGTAGERDKYAKWGSIS
ncbi:unnamed protein product [Ascophyllum nodosum]